MLQVTNAAASVLSEMLQEHQPQGEPATVIRIRPVANEDGRQSITLQPVPRAEPGDVPTEAENLDVFVAPELAGALEAGVLDVETTPQGPELILREQSGQG